MQMGKEACKLAVVVNNRGTANFPQIELGVPEHEVAVVTPYQAQVSLISSMIHEDHPSMTIGSVDGLQGQEREVSFIGEP